MKKIQLSAIVMVAILIPSVCLPDTLDLTDPILPKVHQTAGLQKQSDTAAAAPSRIAADGELGAATIQTDRRGEPASIDSAGFSAAFGEPGGHRSAVPAAITIEGRTYDVALVSRVLDPKYGVQHLTMRVLNVPDSYARFTLGAEDEIVGTVHTPSATYRLLPGSAPGAQRAVLIRSLGNQPASYRRVLQSDASPSARQLERRHTQLEHLADIAPETVMSSEHGGSLYIRGGQLGRMDVGRVTATELARLLRQHADLNFVPDAVDVRVKDVYTSVDGRQITFEQVVNGVPVWLKNSIQAGADGRILEMNTQFVDPSRVESLPLLSRTEAIKYATRAVEEKFKVAFADLELRNDAQLYYHLVPGHDRLVPRYVFDFDTKTRGSWRIIVNAHTGDADVFDPTQYAAGFRVCRDNSPTQHPTNCTDAGADVIWRRAVDSSTFNCPYINPRADTVCKDLEPLAGQLGTRRAIEAFEVVGQTNPALCCAKIGGPDRTIDVIYRTSGTAYPGARYDPTADAIQTPVGDYSMQSIETVWHEVGHHVLQHYNRQIADLYNVVNEVFGSTFNEAFADLIQAATAELTPVISVGPHTFGDPWILGDGRYGGPDRNLKDTSLDFTRLTLNLSNHERGQAITSYFYQVKQASGITSARFMELLLKVADVMRDFDNNGLDLIDMKGALLQAARSDETALRNAINSKFDVMYAPLPGDGSGPLPVGVPAPAGAPPPPFPVAVVFAGCTQASNGAWLSAWRVDWPAVQGATRYVGYLKFRYSTYIQDSATTTGLQLYAYTNTAAWVMVASCNASGCGRTSVQTAIDHQSLCQH